MNVNFFTWIREGVKHSVLLGVGDAIETLGTPETNEADRDALLNFLRSDDKKIENKSTTKRASTNRRRLGKSLKEIGPADK